ncbi:MAG TPA: F0F1 ATP synthase subunit A [Emcibacteraceae bacterium]|nr:F0F1 ATP synthase subunit A [Emcibacteraceae bacterium]
MGNPFSPHIAFMIGPVPISMAVVTTWGIIVLLALLCWLSCRKLQINAGRWQSVLEILITGIDDQITQIIDENKVHFFPLIATLFIFICLANLIDIVPGLSSPTAVLETTAALAVITFFSVHYVGIKSKGLLGYLKSFTEPNIILLPFTILSQITRTFSMMVRLFGNMMSGQFLMGIILAFVGLLVPIPLMILHVLISILQAYIFTILATVFIAAAIAEDNKGD